MNQPSADSRRLAALDREHVWHPFTPMLQWRQSDPLIIAGAEGCELIDTDGNRYLDGVSSLWCNVHGHTVPQIDGAIRDQLAAVAHTTLLGMASPPSIELAARLCRIAPGALNKVFYSDAGAAAVEVALKMAVGYWHHNGHGERNRFIGFGGAYHGDTTGAMSVGFSDLFHRPFASMVFPTTYAPLPDPCREPREVRDAVAGAATGADGVWPSEDGALGRALRDRCLGQLKRLLEEQGKHTAAVVIEPIVQGAAGIICQPQGFLRGVHDLAREHGTLLIADEVATGFGRTGTMFACAHERVEPDIMCLGKGLSGGYLPLAATLATDRVEQAFCGELAERRTLYHGHTFTGNALGCAAAMASLDLFESSHLLEHVAGSARIIAERLEALRPCPHVLDVRQRGIMVGIEFCRDRAAREPFDFSKRTGSELCLALRCEGVILRPLGDVIVLMPIPAMPHEMLQRMLDTVVRIILAWPSA